MKTSSRSSQVNWVEEHRGSVFASLRKMRSSGQCCDVFLKCLDSDHTYPAHSCIVSAASPVIEKLINDAEMTARKESKVKSSGSEEIVVILPDDVSESVMESLLELMYGGDYSMCKNSNSVEIRASAYKSLQKAARCLKIDSLIEMLKSIPERDKPPDSSRPPKRASAIKFQNSLKNYLGKNPEPALPAQRVSPKARKRNLRSNTSPSEIKSWQKETSDSEERAQCLQKVNMEKYINGKTEIDSDVQKVKLESGRLPENNETETTDSANASKAEDQLKDDSELPKSRRKLSQPNQFTNDEYWGTELDALSDMENDNTAQDDDPGSCQDEWKPKIDVRNKKHEGTDTQEVKKDQTNKNEGKAIRKTKSSIFSGKYRRQKRKPKDSLSSGPYSCLKCGKECLSENKLKHHMKSHNTRVDLMCTFCQQVFKYKMALQRHLRWHTGDGQKCPICGKDVFSQREMSQHMTSHNSKKMRTQCLLCQKWFTSSYVMQLHMRTHTGDELFYCQICDKKFPYKSSLKTHMLLHTGEKPYMCSVCGKSFTQKIHAREHELQHAGFKRFQCTYCDRYFAHKCGLTRHVSDIHHKNRPYVCETCGKRFPRKTKLVEHTRIHTGEKPYVCDICGVKYKANRSLKFHKKNRHNIIVPNYEVAIWKRAKPTSSSFAEPKSESVQENETYTPIFMPLENVSPVQDKDAVIEDIAEEVSVMTAERSSPAAPTLPESHFEYPITPAVDQSPTTQIETAHVGIDAPQTTKVTSVQNHHINRTYIVPLNASTSDGFPMQALQPNQGLAGMVFTYMMSINQNQHSPNMQPVEVCQPVTTGYSIPSMSTSLSRSSSVPPMSTFRRPAVMVQKMSDASTFHNSNTAVSLPGLQTTYQPVTQTNLPPMVQPTETISSWTSQ